MSWETVGEIEGGWETLGEGAWETLEPKAKSKAAPIAAQESLLTDQLSAPGAQLQIGESGELAKAEGPIRWQTIASLPARFMGGAGKTAADIGAMTSEVEAELIQPGNRGKLLEAQEMVRRMAAGYKPSRKDINEAGPIVEQFVLKATRDNAATTAELEGLIRQTYEKEDEARRGAAVSRLTASGYRSDIEAATPPDETFLEKAAGIVAESGAPTVLGLAFAPIAGAGAATMLGSVAAGLSATANSYEEITEQAKQRGLNLSTSQKALIAATDGLIETVGEGLSLKVALKSGPVVFRRWLEIVGAEASSEGVTEVFQQANAAVNYRPDMTLREFLYSVALATTAGAMGGGTIAASVQGAQAIVDKVEQARYEKQLGKAVDEMVRSENPALLTPEQEALRLLDPKVSGRPVQTPLEAFDHLVKTNPYEAVGFYESHQEALGEGFMPVKRAKELFTEGRIEQRRFLELRNAFLESTAHRTEGKAEVQGAIETAAATEQQVLEATPDYIPTDSDLADVELAKNLRKLLETDGQQALKHALRTLEPTSLVRRVIGQLARNPEDVGDLERGHVFGSRMPNETTLLAYFERAATRQMEGLYPFAPEKLNSEIHPYLPVPLPWGRVSVMWRSTGASQTLLNLEELQSGEVVAIDAPSTTNPKLQARAQTLADWVRRFAPDLKILHITKEAGVRLGLINPLEDLFGGSNRSGFNAQMAPGTQLIFVSERVSEEEVTEVLAHEFGHALFNHLLARSPARVREAMMRAWAHDVRTKLKMPIQAFWKSTRGPVTAAGRMPSAPSHWRNLEDAIAEHGYFRDYINNWDEWSAHRAERALAKDFRGMQEPVKRFFQRYVEMLRRLWQRLENPASDTYEKFLDYHHQRAQAKEAAALRYAAMEGELQKLGFEQLSPEEAQDAQRFLLHALGKIDAPQELIDEMVNATPVLRERAKIAIERIGPVETAMLTPTKAAPVKLSAEEYTTSLEDAWLPGQSPRASLVYSESKPPSTRFAGRAGSFIRNSVKHSRMFRGRFAPDLSEYEGHLDKFGWFAKWAYTLEQIAKVNPHIEQLQAYVNQVREWARDRMAWIARAEERLRKWRKLNATEQKVLGQFLLDQTQQQTFFDLNDPEVRRKYPLSERALSTYNDIRSDFVDFISAIEGALLQSAAKRMSHNPFAAAAEMERIKDRFGELKKKPYFPLSRFGKYLVVVRATKHIRIKGNLYQPGDVMHFEAFDTNFARMAELDRIKGMYPSGDLKLDVASEAVRSLMGLPTPVIDALKNDPNIGLSAEQKKAVDEYLYKIAPGQSFSKHLIQRKGVEGYTEDVRRAYANYFFHGASHLARIKHAEALSEDIKALDVTADLITADSSKRRAIANYMRRHFNFLMNPENDWSAVRAVIAVAYLGAVLKTAWVNLTQVGMTTYPHLAAQYGDLKAIGALKGAYGDAMAMYHVTKALTKAEEDAITRWSQGQPLQPGDEKIVSQWSKLTTDERRMLRQAVLEGWIDESQAMELAAMSEGSWLTRFKTTSQLGYYARSISHYAMIPFQAAEKLNRRVTAIAAFRLAIQNGYNFDVAYQKAREAVSATQYEYAKWNRPELLRGKKGVLFMFWQFGLNTLFFATGGDAGWWRWWAMMLGAAGVMGLPFAENLMDLATWAMSRADKRVNARYEVTKAVEKLAETLAVEPDLLLHGISRYGFGLIPFADLSGSMGMGRVLPGTEVLAAKGTGKWEDRVAAAASEVGGASTALVMRMLQAVSEDHPDTLRRIERGMPVTVGQNILTTLRWIRDGANKTLGGATLTEFDLNDPWELAEVIGKGAFGLQPRSVSKGRPEESQPGREETLLKQDFANYYRIRREMLLRHLDHEIEAGDNESKQQVIDAIRRFNAQVPSPALRIGNDTIYRMRREKERSRQQLERGQPPQRMFRDLYRQVEEREL